MEVKESDTEHHYQRQEFFWGQPKRAQKSDRALKEDKAHSLHLPNLQALRVKGRLGHLY